MQEIESHYQRIGGEEKVRTLVTRFYQLMDELPEAYGLGYPRSIHKINIATALLFC